MVPALISSAQEQLILVNEQDEAIGSLSKRECHAGAGVLHRAFSIFIFNSAAEVLLQKRSAQKHLWPLHWSNACCSHPRQGEAAEAAAQHRLAQELGIKTSLSFLYKFIYQAQYQGGDSEHELCWVWVGEAEAEAVTANSNEVAEWRFFPVQAVNTALIETPEKFTPWMKLEWQALREHHQHQLPAGLGE